MNGSVWDPDRPAAGGDGAVDRPDAVLLLVVHDPVPGSVMVTPFCPSSAVLSVVDP